MKQGEAKKNSTKFEIIIKLLFYISKNLLFK